MLEFVEYPKIARYSRMAIVTEKIDGTNACIHISEDGEFFTGSRTRWITPETDNHGFSRWAHTHKADLMSLGTGTHFGEWWGSGCQRGYGLPSGEKRFSLFNVVRWCLHNGAPKEIPTGDPRVTKVQEILPACVGLVPVLWTGLFDLLPVEEILDDLRRHGSYAAPGFHNPEGIVIYHCAAGIGFKKTLERDDVPKSHHTNGGAHA